MRYKIFEAANDAVVMVMETNENTVEFYMQISSSSWDFCDGYDDNFDKVDQSDADSIAEQYYDQVVEDEKVLEEHFNEVMCN